MKFLFISQLDPNRISAGQYLRFRNILRVVGEQHDVVTLTRKEYDQIDESLPIKERYFFPNLRKGGVFSNLCRRLKTKGYLFPENKVWKEIRDCIEKEKPDIVVFQYMFWGQYAKGVKKLDLPVWMVTHNSQSDLHLQSIRAGKTWRIDLWLFYFCFYLHEKYLFKNFDKILSVSQEDVDFHAKIVGEKKSFLMPNFVWLDDYTNKSAVSEKASYGGNLRLLLSGSFNSFQNYEAAIWFVEKVVPALVNYKIDFILKIVGRSADKVAPKCTNHKNIEIHSNPEDMTSFFQSSDVAIVPIFYGSGTRWKILEALASKLVVVTTGLGIEGIDLEEGQDYLKAETAEDFARQIKYCADNRAAFQEIAFSGHGTLKNKYSENAARLAFDEILGK